MRNLPSVEAVEESKLYLVEEIVVVLAVA